MDTNKKMLKKKSAIELIIGLFILFGFIWWIIPLYHTWIKFIFIIIILGFFIFSKYNNNERLSDLGFSFRNIKKSGIILTFFTILSGVILYLIWKIFFPVNINFYNESVFWEKLITYPVEALFQQYIALAFFFRRFRDFFYPNIFPAVFLSAITFSAVHMPTPPLVIICFIGGLFWASIYHKYNNIFTITISHAVLGIFCSNILLMYTIVGPNADIARWSKSPPVYHAIDRINNIRLTDSKEKIEISKDNKFISVNGWVAGVREDIDKIYIRISGKDYLVKNNLKREDVAMYYNNPEYTNSGFKVNIPVSDLNPDYHSLYLKILLKDHYFHHYPSKRVWIKIN